MSSYTINQWLSFELLFALTFTCLLANGLILLSITFGDQIVTSLTKKPYVISFFLLTLMSIEFLWICYTQQVTYGNDKRTQFEQDFFATDGVYSRIESNIMLIKIDLVLLFILNISYEYENLLVFVNFQRKLRLQDLNVERDTFIRLEKRIRKIFVSMTVIFLAPNLFILWGFVLFNNDDNDHDNNQKSLWWFYLFQNMYQGGLLIMSLILC